MRLYEYVGPQAIRDRDASGSPRVQVLCSRDVRRWVNDCGVTPDRDGNFTATYVVLPDGLWIAPRQSEHVACARGSAVLAAGELRFEIDARNVTVVEASNQSTGYCPAPTCWEALKEALRAAGLSFPAGFTLSLEFRRCTSCESICVIKDGDFRCIACGTDLPLIWNCGRR